MNRTRLTLTLSTLSILAATVVFEAGATATTHIWAPSTDVQRPRSIHVTYDLYVPVESSASGDRLPSVTNLGLTWGAVSLHGLGMELGVDHKTGYGRLDEHPLYFNGKLGLSEGTFHRFMPALAVGIFDVGTRGDLTDADVLYAKAARTLGPIGRISAGWFAGNEELLLDASGKKDSFGPMAAWERAMPEISERLWLCVDYMGTRSAYGALSIGGSWRFADAMTVLVGYDIFNESRIAPDTFTLQADVDFDF